MNVLACQFLRWKSIITDELLMRVDASSAFYNNYSKSQLPQSTRRGNIP